MIFCVICVAVTQMEELGIDGFSIGDFLEWVMAGKYPLEMLTMDTESLDRLGGFKKRIRNWWVCQTLIKLDLVG